MSAHGIVTMSSTAIVAAALLAVYSTLSCASYGLRFMLGLFTCVALASMFAENCSENMMMMSLFNTVLNMTLMVMAFFSECLMFAFFFSAYLTLSLSVAYAVNVCNMGESMTITVILSALALSIAVLVSSPGGNGIFTILAVSRAFVFIILHTVDLSTMDTYINSHSLGSMTIFITTIHASHVHGNVSNLTIRYLP